jgi:hypothetical protein
MVLISGLVGQVVSDVSYEKMGFCTACVKCWLFHGGFLVVDPGFGIAISVPLRFWL